MRNTEHGGWKNAETKLVADFLERHHEGRLTARVKELCASNLEVCDYDDVPEARALEPELVKLVQTPVAGTLWSLSKLIGEPAMKCVDFWQIAKEYVETCR